MTHIKIFGLFAKILTTSFSRRTLQCIAPTTPVIYLNSQQNFTIALGVYSFANTLPGGLPHQELLMAVGMLMVAPLALAFLLAQRLTVRGVVISGLKG